MLEEIATTLILGALKKLWDYLKEYFASKNNPSKSILLLADLYACLKNTASFAIRFHDFSGTV